MYLDLTRDDVKILYEQTGELKWKIILEMTDWNNTDADLKDYLLSHEYDIAVDLEDFGGLRANFVKYIGREPSNSLHSSRKEETK